jgi:hypothetical protein
MVTTCLSPAEGVDVAFGPAGRVALNTGSATGEVRGTPVAFLLGGARIAAGILGAKVRRQTPGLFFNPSGQTLRTAYPLNAGERHAVGLETG